MISDLQRKASQRNPKTEAMALKTDESKQAPTPHISRQTGFTLTELMITIGVFSILAAIAVPGFLKLRPDFQLRSAARDLLSGFQLAKMTAVRSGHNCAITFNQPVDGETYGYVVFRDEDNDVEYDTGEDVVKKVKWTDYDFVSVTGNNLPQNDDGLCAIAFRSNGLPRNNGGGFGAGTVSLKNTNNNTKDVVLSPAGNIRIE
jgi:type IV fimbrial biogenesis protein FimT